MIYAVDGTGPADNKQYKSEFSTSFCYQLHQQMTLNRCWYWRGPEISGSTTSAIMEMVYQRVMNDYYCRADTANQAIYLVGYSRGALACIATAQKLEKSNTPVKALFMFDAVDRCMALDGSRIPANVEKVYHARRDPKFGETLTAELSVAWNQLLVDSAVSAGKFDPVTAPIPVPGGNVLEMLGFMNEIRPALLDFVNRYIEDQTRRFKTRNTLLGLPVSVFGNTGLVWGDSSKKIETEFFMGSHGALGGCPWPSTVIPNDNASATQVYNWMWKNFDKEGLLNRS